MRLRSKWQRSIILLIFIILLGLDFQPQAWAQSVEAVTKRDKNGESPSGLSGKEIPEEPKMLDLTGEKVGKQIDELTQKASSRIGGWINAKVFSGITWFKLGVILLLLFLVFLLERIVRLIIVRQKRKTGEEEVKTVKYFILNAAAKPLSIYIWVYGIYFALTPLFEHFRSPDGTNLVHMATQKAVDLGVILALVWFIFKLVSIVDFQLKKWADKRVSTIDDVLAPIVGKSLRVFIVIIGSIIIIQNLTGVKIGPLLASLGIGGIAVALAAKDSIANFFGTMTIIFDRPFQIGDRILLDNYDGVVEDVGFRSTRIRTLTGHLVTIPNEKVINSGLENVSKRPHIRWLTNITINYDTPPDQVEKAVSIIKEILDHHEGMHPDFPPRVYFNGFNDWSLNIIAIAWYHPANYWDMQEWLQRTCLEILRRFNDEGIDFAFPSRTVYMANDEKRQLKIKMLQGETITYSPNIDGRE